MLREIFGPSWSARNIASQSTVETINQWAPRTSFRSKDRNQRSVEQLAALVCHAAVGQEEKFKRLDFWLGRLSVKDLLDLPPRAFVNKFPLTLAGFLNASTYILGPRVSEIWNYPPNVKRLIAFDRGLDQHNDLNPEMPMDGTAISTLINRSRSWTEFPEYRKSANSSALTAWIEAMPDVLTIRQDLKRHEREQLRFEALRESDSYGAFPTRWNVHDVMSFTRGYWWNKESGKEPEFLQQLNSERTTARVHVFLKHAFGDEFSENIDMTDWTFADLAALAIENGFDKRRLRKVSETFDAWEDFRLYGTIEPSPGDLAVVESLEIEPLGLAAP